MTFRQFRDSKSLLAANLSQLQQLLMIRLRRKMTDLQRIAVADEAPVAREEVGGEGIAERAVGEVMAEEALTEIVVVGVVSSSVGCWLIHGLTYHPDPAYRGRGDERGEGKKSSPVPVILSADPAFIRPPW